MHLKYNISMLVICGSIFTQSTGFCKEQGVASEVTVADATAPSIHLSVYMQQLANNKLFGKKICEASDIYKIPDTRGSRNNADPKKILKDCLVTFNGAEIKVEAFVGAGIYTDVGPDGKTPAARRAYLVVLNVGDKQFSNWNSSFDTAPHDIDLTWDLPIPDEFRVPGTDQWLHVVSKFREENSK